VEHSLISSTVGGLVANTEMASPDLDSTSTVAQGTLPAIESDTRARIVTNMSLSNILSQVLMVKTCQLSPQN
jgi:hypothetical protein